MKTSSILAIFALIIVTYSMAASNDTFGQFGAGHEPQQKDPVRPLSALRSWLKAKRTTDAGKSLNSRPSVRPYYTTQSRPVDHHSYGTSRRMQIFNLRQKSTVHSYQVTTPRPTVTETKRTGQNAEHAVTLVLNAAVTRHDLVTARHSNAVNKTVSVTKDNFTFTKSHAATSGHPTATTARRTATVRHVGNTTDNHRVTTEKSPIVQNRTSVISKPQNTTIELNVTVVDQIVSGDSDCTTFICDDGHTLSGDSFVCDGVEDCIDGSDEVSGDDNNCSDTKTLCWGGICINRYMQEAFAKFCEPTPQPEVDVKTTECQSDSEYLCANKAQCVDRNDICDGVSDCDDGSDESACPCGGFQCRNGNCVSETATCDGVDDCDDSSDESLPTCTVNKNPRDCSEHFATGRFHCNNGLCVEKSSVCDGISDCGDQTDENDALCNHVTPAPKEAFCGPSQYVCSNRNCVTKDKICDDTDDCGDNSDEDFCYFNSGSGFVVSALVYGFAGAGGIIVLIILIALVAHCRKRKTPARRTIQRSPALNMPAPPPSYEESGPNLRNAGVSFENPLSELKARF